MIEEKVAPLNHKGHMYTKQKANWENVNICWSNYNWPTKGRELNKTSVCLQSQTVSDRLCLISTQWSLQQQNRAFLFLFFQAVAKEKFSVFEMCPAMPSKQKDIESFSYDLFCVLFWAQFSECWRLHCDWLAVFPCADFQ